jgi:hypothetical protein
MTSSGNRSSQDQNRDASFRHAVRSAKPGAGPSTAGVYSSIAPEVGTLELPFMLDTPEKVIAAVNDPVVRGAIFPKDSRNDNRYATPTAAV